jgi:hypothetical protein
MPVPEPDNFAQNFVSVARDHRAPVADRKRPGRATDFY